MQRTFKARKGRTLLTVGLASAALFLAVAAAPAGNAAATSPAGRLQVERFGPKYLLGRRNPQTHSITAKATATLVDEFGPKYLLRYELNAAQS
jgi:hypothetical protein